MEGGPYGAEVTRGLDPIGKEFSGKASLKQDFKTLLINQIQAYRPSKFIWCFRLRIYKSSARPFPRGLSIIYCFLSLIWADLSDADPRGPDFSLANVSKVKLAIYAFSDHYKKSFPSFLLEFRCILTERFLWRLENLYDI